VALGDEYVLEEGGTLTGSSVLANDTDAEDTELIAILGTAPAYGDLTLNSDGTFEYVHDGSESLSDLFTYRANDGELNSDPVEVVLTMTPVNDTPVALGDEYVLEEGATLVGGSVLANDTDAEETALIATLMTEPVHGELTLNPDGTFEYVHDGSETLADTFTYTASDGELDSESVEVVLTVTPVNDAPVALGDEYVLDEGTTMVGSSVLANDTDAEEAVLIAIQVTAPSHGELTLNPNGTFEYAHDGSETLSDSFTYKANDGELDSEIVEVVLTITSTNSTPVALGDEYVLEEGATLVGGSVLANDTDAEETALIATLVSDPVNGDLTLNSDGTFEYVHDGSETLSDTFTYQASDGELDSESVEVVLTVTPVNDAPVALGGEYVLDEGTTLVGGSVLANDTDAEETALIATLVSDPVNGDLTLNSDGTFEYIHDGSETLTDTFTYKANDGELDSESVEVVLTVTPINDAPVALGDVYVLEEGATLAGSSVLANDTDTEETALIATLVTDPVNGELTLNPDGTFEYIHDGSETLTDTFTYKANDGELDSEIVEVVLTITSTNSTPVALGDEYLLEEGGTLTGSSVLANDTDAEGTDLVAILETSPAYGDLTLNSDGTFEYIHDGSETLTDTFTYRASDGELESDSVEVVLTMTPVNDVPVALGDVYVLEEGATLVGSSVLANDTDAEETALIATLMTDPVNGELTLNPDGTFEYVHDGSETLDDIFTYRANDGEFNSESVEVVLVVTPVNDAPIALDDEYVLVEGEILLGESVLLNDIDAEETPLNAVLVSGPEHGDLTLDPIGTFTYAPHGGEALLDGFSYVANDGELDSEVAFVSILINPFHGILIDALVGLKSVKTAQEVVISGSLLSQKKIEIGQSGQITGDLRNVEGEIKLKSDAAVNGVVVAGGKVNLESKSRVGLNVRSGDDVTLKSNAEVQGDVTASGSVSVHQNASVGGVTTENALAPMIPDIRLPDLEIEAGGGNVDLAKDEAFSLPPGVYGKLKMKQGAVLILSEGDYSFDSVDGKKGSIIKMNSVSGAIRINVVGDFKLDQESEIQGLSADGFDPATSVLIQVQGEKVKLGQKGHYLGTFMAPNADIDLEQNAVFSGALYGKRVQVGKDTIVNVRAAIDLMIAATADWLGIENNEVPEAFPDNYILEEGTLLVGESVLLNDTDPEGATLSAELIALPEHGSLVLAENGSFEYTHDGSETVVDSFTYEASDGDLVSAETEVQLTILPVNDPPEALDDSYSYEDGVVLQGDSLLGNDFDAEGSPLTAVLVSPPENGALTLYADGTFEYLHDGSENSDDFFTYSATDGELDSEPASVALTGHVNPFLAVFVNALVGFDSVKVDKDSEISGDLISQRKIEIGESAKVTGSLLNVTGKIDLKRESEVSAQINAGGMVSLANQAKVGADIVSGANVDLKSKAQAQGNITASGKVKLHKNAVAEGVVTENAPEPVFEDVVFPGLDLSHAGPNLVVKGDESLLLPPGNYGHLKLRKGAVLLLSSGEYQFDRVDGEASATIDMDLLEGAILVNVVGDFKLKKKVEMRGFAPEGIDPALNILIQVQGKKVSLGEEGRYLGTIMAPNADIELGKEVELTGALFGKTLHLGSKVKIQVKAALDLLIAASESWTVDGDGSDSHDSNEGLSLHSISDQVEPSIRLVRTESHSADRQELNQYLNKTSESVEDDRIVFFVRGAPNHRYQLLRSDDLSNWSQWRSVETDQHGYVIVRDADSFGQMSQFFRFEAEDLNVPAHEYDR